MEKQFYVYILASDKDGSLYVGVTSDLLKRMGEHENKAVSGATSRYHTGKLVYFEIHDNDKSAIRREKRLKFWERDWKVTLIERNNPEWHDLYPEIGGDPSFSIMEPTVKSQDDDMDLVDN